jgi:hypothetical protein
MPKQVRVDLVEAVELGLGLGRGVVADGLQVDGRGTRCRSTWARPW